MKEKTETSSGGIVFKRLTSNDKRLTTLWLICQHSYHKGWVFPKGLIGDKESNESKEEAALREVEEEGGIKTKIIHPEPVIVHFDYQWKGSPHAKGNEEIILVHKTVYYYLMEYISGDPKDHDWEMSDVKFVKEDEVIKTLTYESDKEAFKKILALMKLKQ